MYESRPNAVTRLYRGLTSVDFVGRRKIWFAVSALVIVMGAVSLGVRGLNLGIDFKGGNSWQVTAKNVTQTEALNAVTAAGLTQPTVYILGGRTINVEADLNSLSSDAQKALSAKVRAALAQVAHTTSDQVSSNTVGPTWGGQVTKRALWALLAFFIAVLIYISARFEPKMALAAFVAMIHDLLVTLGVYSLFGFQITPDTVIAILTILGYSLYDTVVVFDRVRDNSRGVLNSGALSYSDMVNLSMNQTLARSINTSLVAIMPVLAVLLVGAELLGATTLQNYGLALFVGLMSGAYSSIFIASPLLAILKEREPRYRELARRVSTRSAMTPAAAAVMGSETTSAVRSAVSRYAVPQTTVTPKGRKQKRR
jgi:preprotein translocase subunit SecF